MKSCYEVVNSGICRSFTHNVHANTGVECLGLETEFYCI
jgi:hypothetical protein